MITLSLHIQYHDLEEITNIATDDVITHTNDDTTFGWDATNSKATTSKNDQDKKEETKQRSTSTASGGYK